MSVVYYEDPDELTPEDVERFERMQAQFKTVRYTHTDVRGVRTVWEHDRTTGATTIVSEDNTRPGTEDNNGV